MPSSLYVFARSGVLSSRTCRPLANVICCRGSVVLTNVLGQKKFKISISALRKHALNIPVKNMVNAVL